MLADTVRARAGRFAPVALGAVVAIGLLTGACTEPSARDSREAAVYETILRWVLADTTPVDPDTAPRVFVASLDADAIALEVQVETIERVEGEMALRFIDDRDEAIADDATVRDGGVLVGLGPVAATGPVAVRVEVYRDADGPDAYLVEVTGRGENWEVDGFPEPLPVEELVEEE